MIKTNLELAAALKNVAANYKTLYVMGCFGAPMTAKNKKRYTANHSYNKKAERTAMINAATADTYGFDCVCLIKGLLWGWTGDINKNYGGASYASNGVPDVSADGMIARCNGVSANFAGIEIGEAVWMSGHIGVYIGDGLAVECTPKWKNCVQITAVGNIGKKSGYNTRTWTKHGKLPYITYVSEQDQGAVQASGSAGSTAGTSATGERPLKISSNVKAVQTWLNTYYNAGLAVNGSFDTAIKRALIKAWQREVGGLAVDGSFGPACKTAASRHNIRKGDKGILVTIWQAFLICRGYDPNGIDGSFGAGCERTTIAWQSANALTPDGVVGSNTWYKALH